MSPTLNKLYNYTQPQTKVTLYNGKVDSSQTSITLLADTHK